MDLKDAEFLKRLQEVFREEAGEHIRAITAGLLDLENFPSAEKQTEIIETIFRGVHSLKGSARSVGLKEIESICHPMETVFYSLKKKAVPLAPHLFNLLHRCVDFISPLVSAPGVSFTVQNRSQARELIKQLGAEVKPMLESAFSQCSAPSHEEAIAEAVESGLDTPARIEAKLKLAETVRISTHKLDPLLYQAEELIVAKLAGIQRVQDLQEIHQQVIVWKTESGKWRNRLSAVKKQSLNEFVELNDSRFHTVQSQLLAINHSMEQDQRNLRRMVDEHLEAMKRVLMLPVSALTESFPKAVRDLSQDQGKKVDLFLVGGEIGMDKRILEELKDPLIHLLRNCVDHGMRKPQERASQNKPPRGTINITFTALEDRHVEILIADDGEGIDLERVKAAAVKAGVVSSEASEKFSREETLSLIYRSGLSTSPIITDISGRGLGMTIVHDQVEKLGGIISVATEVGLSTTFRIVVPLTLATFRGVLVRAGESVFVLPTANVERVVRVRPEDIETVENRETISLDNRIVAIVELSRALAMPVLPKASDGGSICLVVLKSGEMRLGFRVDEVLSEHQVLIKSLGKQLSRVRNIAGATVLGTGKVILVLNVPDLMKSGVRTVNDGRTEVTVVGPVTRTGRILAADDSITARTLIKNILENAGYSVKSAVDGAEAFALAKSEDFDLLVSDIDMPRLSGFELAAKIRADKNLCELPIVLVSALGAREERERGIDVGANAYIVKSDFDQSNLLEAVKRLLC